MHLPRLTESMFFRNETAYPTGQTPPWPGLYAVKRNCLFRSEAMKTKDIMIGMKFGRLTVLEFTETDKWYDKRYKCICECGNTHTTTVSYIKYGR